MDLTNSTIITPPQLGERTSTQLAYGGGWGTVGISGLGTNSFLQTFGVGLAIEPFPGTYHNYRRMSSSPTPALAKAVKVQPMLTAKWGYLPRKGVSDEITGFIRDMFDPMRGQILDDMMMALDMGCQSGELVWDVHQGTAKGLPSTRYVIRKIKPLVQEATSVRLDPDTQQFIGVRNGNVDLDVMNCFHYVYDFTRGGWYGRSIHENYREEFCEYEDDRREMRKLTSKLASVIAVAKVIKGLANDNGKPIDRHDAAKALIQNLAGAKGVVFDSVALNVDDVRNNPDLLKVTDIMLEVLDLGSSAPAMAPLLQKRKDLQAEFMQAWLLPPRSALEGQHGTLAEAEVHANVGITGSELTHAQATSWFQQHVVNKVLAVNFGPDYVDAVRVMPAPILDEKRQILMKVLDGILQNGPIFEAALSEDIDADDVYNQLGVPKKKTVTNTGGEQ